MQRIFAVFFITISLAVNAQVKLVRLIWPTDSARSLRYYPIDGPLLQWNNWFYNNRESVPKKSNYDVYYDDAFKRLGYSFRGTMSDTGWVAISSKEYYVDGRLLKETTYNPDGSGFREITNDFWGDTTMDETRVGIYDVKSFYFGRKKWEPEKRYLIARRSFDPLTKIQLNVMFDEDGDTIYYDSIPANGRRVIVSYQDKKLFSVTTSDTSGKWVTRTIKYAPDQIYSLKLSPKNSSVLDSLSFYKNVKKIRLELTSWDTIGQASFLNKIEALSSLQFLEEVQLTGKFADIPTFVFRCKRILSLNIHGSVIRSIPPEIRKLTLLNSLKLSSNDSLDYSGSLKNLAPLHHLFELELPLEYGVPLPKDIVQLKNLLYLSLGSYRACTNDSTSTIDLNLIYKLKKLRGLSLCFDQYNKVNIFEFAHRLPDCMITGFETCFDQFSFVTLFNGRSKLISDVQVGDLLLGYNTASRTYEETTVTRVHLHQKPMADGIKIKYHYFSLNSVQTGVITTTGTNPFYVNGQWMIAAEIQSGATLGLQMGSDYTTATVDEVEWYSPISQQVYNFSTSNHTFFVNGILVHNK
jgi:hypothetical protein